MILTASRKKAIVRMAILFSLCGYLFFWRISDLNLIGTEAHRALPAQAMLDTGDWLAPRLNGQPFLTKPPLTYWLIAVSSMPQGKVTEVSARLPSAISAALMIVIIYWLVGAAVGAEAGFLSALVTLTTFLLFEKAVAAEIDMHLTASVAISLLLIYRGVSAVKNRFLYIIGAYIFLTAAFLSKGPPALIFFGATLAPFLLWEKRSRFLWSPANLFGIGIFVFLCAAWVAAVIASAGWDELLKNIREEFVARVDAPTTFRPSDIFFYPIGIAGGMAPWSLFLPVAFLPSYYKGLEEGRRSLQRFLYCGVVMNVLLFSAVAGKANRYLLPIYPLMAILVGLLMHDLMRRNLSERLQKFLGIVLQISMGLSAAGILIFLIVKGLVGVPAYPISLPLLGAMAAVMLMGFLFARKARYQGVFFSIILFFLLIKLLYVFTHVPYKNGRHSIQHIAAEVNSKTVEGDIIYTFSFNMPHIFFYLDAPVIMLKGDLIPDEIDERPGYFLLTDDELNQAASVGLTPLPLCEFWYRAQRLSVVSFQQAAPEENESTPPAFENTGAPMVSATAAGTSARLVGPNQRIGAAQVIAFLPGLKRGKQNRRVYGRA